MLSLEEKIFTATQNNFEEIALEVFRFQAENNFIYNKYLTAIGCKPLSISQVSEIPFLPIQFFKTHPIVCNAQTPQLIFKSSGTSSETTATHYVFNKTIYEQSFIHGFEKHFGKAHKYLTLALLPHYLEQGNSSLVYMVNNFISQSPYKQSNTFLHNHAQLLEQLNWATQNNIETILWGVTYALLEFAEKNNIHLPTTTIIETGGMKGRGKEHTRQELHNILSNKLQPKQICSEYGCTEMLSQAYAINSEIFNASNTLQVYARDADDPFCTKGIGKGALNFIDLANLYSCSFIASQDEGVVYNNKQFSVNGRLDHSDIRGCNMLN